MDNFAHYVGALITGAPPCALQLVFPSVTTLTLSLNLKLCSGIKVKELVKSFPNLQELYLRINTHTFDYLYRMGETLDVSGYFRPSHCCKFLDWLKELEATMAATTNERVPKKIILADEGICIDYRLCDTCVEQLCAMENVHMTSIYCILRRPADMNKVLKLLQHKGSKLVNLSFEGAEFLTLDQLMLPSRTCPKLQNVWFEFSNEGPQTTNDNTECMLEILKNFQSLEKLGLKFSYSKVNSRAIINTIVNSTTELHIPQIRYFFLDGLNCITRKLILTL